MSEGRVQRDILDILAFRPTIHAYRVNAGKVKVRGGWMQLAPKDTSDIGGYLEYDWRGVVFAAPLAIEVKQPGEEPTEGQYAYLASVRQAGGVAFWTADPGMVLDEIDRQIDGLRARLDAAAGLQAA